MIHLGGNWGANKKRDCLFFLDQMQGGLFESLFLSCSRPSQHSQGCAPHTGAGRIMDGVNYNINGMKTWDG